MDYIEPIQFSQYPTAAHFAIVQQKGYSYPRFRSHEKIKIPKANCEDKFRVTDIKRKSTVVGRLFILADGHGGPGCSEYFVRHTPEAVERLCENYTSEWTEKLKNNFQTDVKRMILRLDEDYLYRKRKELEQDEDVDNDGCTLILNIFLGDWMINVNVGDSRTILISAPIPMPGKPDLVNTDGVLGMDNDYKMDVVFASQDHKPYLEHLAREILENGGEFVDSVQNRVIKVEVDKLREDRLAKRGSLKNARIRPKGHEVEGEMERIPSLNVARSCGDLDFKMNPAHKIISCEPDVTFIKIKKVKKRHFLFMSTDGTFDYMYEETADKQNRAIAKMIGTMIEKGERAGKYLLEEDESEYNDNQRKDCNPRVIIESMEEDGSQSSDQSDNQEPGIPLLYRELTEEETYTRKIKERTLIHSARYFANREGAQTFFASTLQDYDDCTIILVEI
ncbi:hypothetical protein G6F56_000215 [Rhizopus delemar]|uniref:protein-serine/threonine phosphatase n=1 Tax=Rhizopus stolonifer TaxID=4846 RepID=A0A367JMZ0_RHIST|nr:hypothetical protein G6F56_000215 [Rhizopus delemar]RCH91302.1 hypothetical protein CU098_009474 [Rhizopus stolonifer]